MKKFDLWVKNYVNLQMSNSFRYVTRHYSLQSKNIGKSLRVMPGKG
ncbi:uncharacterized protein METZ01_LOCUS442377, partial [marine metagenome]